MNDSEAEKLATEVKDVVLRSGADLVGIVKAGTIDATPRIWVGWTNQEHTKRAEEVMPDSESIVVIGKYVWREGDSTPYLSHPSRTRGWRSWLGSGTTVRTH
jgi:hypothetical protein